MRFKDLRGLTSLPIDRVRAAFGDEDVLTVLPVNDDGSERDSILVATSRWLAIVTADTGPRVGRWITSRAAWETVMLVSDDERDPDDAGPSMFGLAVRVGGRTFHALLPGATGRKALREFVVAVQARRDALALLPTAG